MMVDVVSLMSEVDFLKENSNRSRNGDIQRHWMSRDGVYGGSSTKIWKWWRNRLFKDINGIGIGNSNRCKVYI